MPTPLTHLRPHHPRTLARLSFASTLAALTLAILGIAGVWDLGVAFGFCVGFMAICIAMASRWESERGQWMLCSLCGGMALFVAVCGMIGLFRDAARGGPNALNNAALDLAIIVPMLYALWISGKHAIANWWLFGGSRFGLPPSPPSPPHEPCGVPAPLSPRPPSLSARAVPAHSD